MSDHAFAVAVLCSLGCSLEFATVIADRVLAPDALLNAGDAEWLKRIRSAERSRERMSSPRWAHAN